MRFRIGVVSVLLCFLVACKQQEPQFTTTTGQQLQFSALKGKWVLINYWAKWCRGCIEEIPVLNRFYLQNKDKVVVLGVEYDMSSKQGLASLTKQLGIKFLVLLQDPATYLNIPAIRVVPTTVVIDPKGKIVATLYGPQPLKNLNQLIK